MPTEVLNASDQIAETCPAGGKVAQNEFIITGRGGLPDNPSETLSNDAVWTDLRPIPRTAATVNYMMMQQVYDHAKAFNSPLNVAYEVGTDATIVSLVSQELGATILPRLAAQPIPPSVQVYSLPAPLNRVIGVAVLADALHPPAIYAFLDILKSKK